MDGHEMMVQLREELAATTVALRQEEEKRSRLEDRMAAMIAFEEADRQPVDIQIHSLLIQLSEAIARYPDLENAIFCAMAPDFVPRLRAQLSIERKKLRTDQGQDFYGPGSLRRDRTRALIDRPREMDGGLELS